MYGWEVNFLKKQRKQPGGCKRNNRHESRSELFTLLVFPAFKNFLLLRMIVGWW